MSDLRVRARSAGETLDSLRDWTRWAASEFGHAPLHYGHGTSEAWDEAVGLVALALRVPLDRLDAMLDARVLPAEGKALADMVLRRVEERVPVPYLTGLCHYAGLEFIVDRRVLIPRSPIAQLLEVGLEPWWGRPAPRRILDLCTGSGCLGILAALAFEEAEVVLADLSEDALDVARANVARHGLDERVTTCASDGLGALRDERPFDLILCNPPYVDAQDLASMPEEFRHEPLLALDGGADGMDLVLRILEDLPRCLAPGGLLVLEVGNSAPALLARAPELNFLWPELPAGGVGVALLEGS